MNSFVLDFTTKIKTELKSSCCMSCLSEIDVGLMFVVEIKSRLKLGNACYYSVQNLLSSRLLSKNLKIKIYRTIILPVVLYGCEGPRWHSG